MITGSYKVGDWIRIERAPMSPMIGKIYKILIFDVEYSCVVLPFQNKNIDILFYLSPVMYPSINTRWFTAQHLTDAEAMQYALEYDYA